MNSQYREAPAVRYHSIDLDYRNELGQRVIVVTCPFGKTTYAIVDFGACNCGHQIT